MYGGVYVYLDLHKYSWDINQVLFLPLDVMS